MNKQKDFILSDLKIINNCYQKKEEQNYNTVMLKIIQIYNYVYTVIWTDLSSSLEISPYPTEDKPAHPYPCIVGPSTPICPISRIMEVSNSDAIKELTITSA